MSPDFTARLTDAQAARQSVVCVGLDPDLRRLPPHLTEAYAPAEAVIRFNQAIIEATAASACAFKLNLAFFEVLGREGWRALEETLAAVPAGTLTIADAKRGDLGNSARFYAEAVFEQLRFDAVTVAPYMGRDSIAPFLAYEGRAAFILARTSNPGAEDFQSLSSEGLPLYLHVARAAAAWDRELPGTVGLVAGATDAEALAALREACPALPFLIPGVGAQGGDAGMVMRAARTEDGSVLVNSSRQILYASAGHDFAEAAAREAETLRTLLAAS